MRPSDKFRQKYDGSGSKGNKQVSELLEKMIQNSSNNSRYQGSENEDDVSMVSSYAAPQGMTTRSRSQPSQKTNSHGNSLASTSNSKSTSQENSYKPKYSSTSGSNTTALTQGSLRFEIQHQSELNGDSKRTMTMPARVQNFVSWSSSEEDSDSGDDFYGDNSTIPVFGSTSSRSGAASSRAQPAMNIPSNVLQNLQNKAKSQPSEPQRKSDNGAVRAHGKRSDKENDKFSSSGDTLSSDEFQISEKDANEYLQRLGNLDLNKEEFKVPSDDEFGTTLNPGLLPDSILDQDSFAPSDRGVQDLSKSVVNGRLDLDVVCEIRDCRGPNNEFYKIGGFPLDIDLLTTKHPSGGLLGICCAANQVNAIYIAELRTGRIIQKFHDKRLQQPGGICHKGERVFIKDNNSIYEFRLDQHTYKLEFVKKLSPRLQPIYGLRLDKSGNHLLTLQEIRDAPGTKRKTSVLSYINVRTGKVDKNVVLDTGVTGARFLNVRNDGAVICSNLQNETVYKVEDGEVTLTFGDRNLFKQVAGIAIDDADNIFIGDSKNFRILFFPRCKIDGSDEPEGEEAPQQENKTLYVCGFSPSVDAKTLQSILLEKLQGISVKKITLMPPSKSANSQPFAFVDCFDIEDAEILIKHWENRISWNLTKTGEPGKSLTVRYKSVKPASNASSTESVIFKCITVHLKKDGKEYRPKGPRSVVRPSGLNFVKGYLLISDLKNQQFIVAKPTPPRA